MDYQGVRRRDTTKGPPLRVLSLDGGGVRGYSMLIIIQELMHRIYVETEGTAPRRDQIPKPCDHFDLIVGTGTGGLIALMLGRLRLDLETCKELYVRLTRMVFETDKTIAGIPYRSTLFKASKLEEAIRECVREHTVFEREGNDGTPDPMSPLSAAAFSAAGAPKRHSSNASVLSFSARSPQAQIARPALNSKYGNPNAKLYDSRENRTKTAVTAIYKGATKGTPPAMLRSYDSRKEPPLEYDCKIWEAGRATCAIGLAFKPIQVGQSVFHDDGAGTFNPAPEALDEAVLSEWPGREVGVFVSVGTGKRPRGSDANTSMWYEGFLGDFAEARRRLIAKIEGCERIHEHMLKEHLVRRGVNPENYYRFNVEIGVGEFGMNEWHRLADISGGTRRYLARTDEQRMLQDASAKLGRIHRAALRAARLPRVSEGGVAKGFEAPEMPFAVELPGDMPLNWPPQPQSQQQQQQPHGTPPSRASYESGRQDNLAVPGRHTPSPRSSADRIRPTTGQSQGSPLAMPAQTVSGQQNAHARPGPPPSSGTGGSHSRVASGSDEPDRLMVISPTPAQYRVAAGTDKIAIVGQDDHPLPLQLQPRRQGGPGTSPRIEPPPLPPKTPLLESQVVAGPVQGRRVPLPPAGGGSVLPYPDDDDEAPPPVNMARKPEYRGR